MSSPPATLDFEWAADFQVYEEHSDEVSDEQIDELARRIEAEYQRMEEVLEQYDFEERSSNVVSTDEMINDLRGR